MLAVNRSSLSGKIMCCHVASEQSKQQIVVGDAITIAQSRMCELLLKSRFIAHIGLQLYA